MNYLTLSSEKYWRKRINRKQSLALKKTNYISKIKFKRNTEMDTSLFSVSVNCAADSVGEKFLQIGT